MKRLPIALIHLYRTTLGRAIGGQCKYHPSCSQYALDAYEQHSVIRATFLSVWRLVRCNPWSHGGVDHVSDHTMLGRGR